MGNSNEIKEKTTLLNIILTGKIPEYFNRINEKFGKKKMENVIIKDNIKYNVITIREVGMLHYDYFKLIDNTIDNLKELVKLLKKVVIIYFQPENDGNDCDKKLIKALSQLEIKYHPFIIFSTLENRNKEYYKNYINDSNIKFDHLNIYSIKVENFEYRREQLFKILEVIENYYNEEENNIYINNDDIGINLCVIGKPGKGKSSFINCIAEEKIALEGEGQNVTKKFNKYKILKRINPGEYGLLNIYDCPGFSLDGTEIENLKSLINEKFTLFKKKNDYIHAFLYFTYNEHNRTLEEKEIELIKHIKDKLHEYGQESIILFIINHIEKENIYKKALLSTLKEKFSKEFENENNIIYVNLKNKIFGIDKVFSILYDYFKINKVEILAKRDDIKQKELINKSIFFKYIEKEDYMISRYRKNCEEIIENYSIKVRDKAKILEKNEILKLRNEMLNRIEATLNSSFYIEDLKLDNNEIGKKWYYKIPLLGQWLEGNFMSDESEKITYNIGNQFIETHIENMREKSSIEFCLSSSKRFNNSIELLKIISELFKEKDDLLIEFKTEIQNNYFIIIFTTKCKEPKISLHVDLTEGNYQFIIKIKNDFKKIEKEIIHIEKMTSNFTLEKLSKDKVDKICDNEKCNVSIYFKLKIIEFEEI